jgi:hypothetical protein
MSGCAAGGLIYSSTVRVPLTKRCVLRHGAKVQSSTVLVHWLWLVATNRGCSLLSGCSLSTLQNLELDSRKLYFKSLALKYFRLYLCMFCVCFVSVRVY